MQVKSKQTQSSFHFFFFDTMKGYGDNHKSEKLLLLSPLAVT